MRLREFDEKERLEKANEKLGKYKTAAGADAAAADASGNFARGNTRFKGINRATKKQFANDAKLSQLKEFAPSGDDGDGFGEEILKRLAAQWWNNDEDPRVEQTLMSAGWEIGQDDGYDNGGVFVVQAGDDQGDSYISWPAEELQMNEVAPPGARAERMVRHIKQGYARDGKLTPREKGIAFATAWKAHNAGQVEEATEDEYQDDYEDEETELCNGCYVRDKEDSSGEIFVMRGDPGDRRVRIEDRHGRGWNIAPYRLTVVDDSDPDIAAYFDDELDEAGVTEAAQGHTIEAHGVRGMDRRTWHKTFRNTDQMIAWAEKHDAEIIGTRDLEQARHHNLSPAKAKGVTEGEYDSRKPFGVRYKVFAGREGRMTTREYWTSSEEKLQRAVEKIQALDNFYEIDGYSYPKESQGVAENKAAGINKMFNNLGDPVYANLQRVALLAMQGRQSEAAGRLQTVIKHADPAVQKKITDAVNSIKPVTINGRVADSSTLDKSKQHNDWIINTFIPWVQSLLGHQDVTEAKTVEFEGVAEGSEQKPAITYKDYTLQYDYQTEDDDPEGYSTATTYYFDVLKDGDRVGEAEYFDYFGNLTIRINGKTKEFGFRHPLASQISQLVSSLPDEQKKDLSDPRFESQDLTEVFADQGSGSTDRDNADYMKKRNAAKKKGYTGRETKAGTWRVFKDGNAVAAAGPFKSADEAAAWIKKHKQGVTEMDKSEPSAGRDTGPRPGPDKEAKPVAAKKATRDAGRMLNKAFRDSHKKKDVKETQLDELSKDTLKDYMRAQPARIKGPAGLATTNPKKAARIVNPEKGDMRRALTKLKDPAYGQQGVAEDSIAAMRRLAGIVTPTPAVVSNAQRQYRHMPTAVQPR